MHMNAIPTSKKQIKQSQTGTLFGCLRRSVVLSARSRTGFVTVGKNRKQYFLKQY